MTAAIALASTSAIAIESFITQPRRSAIILPFPSAGDHEPAEVEAFADSVPVEEEPEIAPIVPAGPANALVDRAALTKAVEIADRVVEKRNGIPILSNLRLVSDGGRIAITGTDIDIELTITVPAAVDAGFATTLPAKLLKDLLKKASASDFVDLVAGEDRVSLDFEKVQYKLPMLPVADFPEISPPAANAHVFTMSGADFWDGIDATMGAISTEETRYYLNGTFMHVYDYGGHLTFRMVSTDGHRLYMREFPVAAGAEGMEGVIVPRKTISLLHTLMKGKAMPDQVSIEVTATRLRFMFGDIVLTSRTIDGTFPDYMRVFPQHNDKIADFSTADLAEALRAVSLISTERGRAFKLELSEDSARLIVNNPDQGSAKADISCAYCDNPVEIGFNSGYMGEILNLIGDAVSFAINDSSSPIIVTGAREGFRAVLMPMRV